MIFLQMVKKGIFSMYSEVASSCIIAPLSHWSFRKFHPHFSTGWCCYGVWKSGKVKGTVGSLLSPCCCCQQRRSTSPQGNEAVTIVRQQVMGGKLSAAQLSRTKVWLTALRLYTKQANWPLEERKTNAWVSLTWLQITRYHSYQIL